jgi:8-oxo-dGTP pyrophosphatase MutT (NUDIX family)
MSTYHPTLNYLYRALVGTESLLGVKINGAQAIVVTDGEVLLIKTTYRPHWEFPGGKIEDLEAPESAAIRETKEESRIFIKQIARKLGTYTRKYFFTTITIHVYVAGEWEELDLWRPTLEIAERKFFPLDQLPEDISPATKRRIDEYLATPHAEFSNIW